MGRAFIKFSSLLLAGNLVTYWILFLSPWEIPSHIPDTPINIDGLILIGLITLVSYLFQKQVLKLHPDTNVFRLILLSTLVCFIQEIIFHVIKLFLQREEATADYVFYFFLGVIGTSLISCFISIPIAFQLKGKKAGPVRVVLTIIAILAYYIIKNYTSLLK